MTANDRWTVYTVTDHPGGGWAVVATLWAPTPQPPGKIVARLCDMTRGEAEKQAAAMQQSYDRLRRAMLAA